MSGSICYEGKGVGLHVAHVMVPAEWSGFTTFFQQRCRYCPQVVGHKGVREDGQVDDHSFSDGTVVLFYDNRSRHAGLTPEATARFIAACELIRETNHAVIFDGGDLAGR